VIHRQQLAQWAGLQPKQFKAIDSMTVYGEESPLLAGNVWLHPNEPGKRDTFSGQPPFCVQLDNGFAVASNRANAPRLPLLGLRALRWANLHSSIDGKNCHASIRTARRFWIFG